MIIFSSFFLSVLSVAVRGLVVVVVVTGEFVRLTGPHARWLVVRWCSRGRMCIAAVGRWAAGGIAEDQEQEQEEEEGVSSIDRRSTDLAIGAASCIVALFRGLEMGRGSE